MFKKIKTNKQQTMLQLTMSALLSAVGHFVASKTLKAPVHIGPYRLVQSLPKASPLRNVVSAIYQHNKKKYVIKTWQGKFKDLQCAELINEYQANELLYTKLKKTLHKDLKISFPRPIDCFSDEENLYIIREYVEGKEISVRAVREQAKILSKALADLETITRSLTASERAQLPQKTALFYIVSLPMITLISLLTHPRKTNTILAEFIKSVRQIPSLKGGPLVISHRDLKPDNIILKNNRLYLIDSSRLALTIGGYDLAYLSLYQDLFRFVVEMTSRPQNYFLRSYISIQYVQQAHAKRGIL